MDTPALAAGWIILMAIVAFGAALGGTTAVYFADKRRPSTPRRAVEDVVDALTPGSSGDGGDEPQEQHEHVMAGSGDRTEERRAA